VKVSDGQKPAPPDFTTLQAALGSRGWILTKLPIGSKM